jgi:hypothetical protein
MARLTWVLAVAGLTTRRVAISSFDRPSAARAMTSRSRSVRAVRAVEDRGFFALAAGDLAYAAYELGRFGVLDQKAAGTPAQRLEDVLIQLERRQDDDLRLGQAGVSDDLAGGGQAVEHGHADVHQHDVGAFPLGEQDGLFAVTGLADHLDVGLGVEQRAESGTDKCLIIGQQYADQPWSLLMGSYRLSRAARPRPASPRRTR